MRFLRFVLKDIKSGQNLDIYITVVLAIVIALLGVLGIADDQIIFSAVLATLAIVSVSLLISRHQNEEIRTAFSNIKSATSVSEQFFSMDYDITELIQRIHNSRRIYFLGTTLTTHIPLLQDDIRQCLQTGLDAKFLLVTPSSSAINMAAFRAIGVEEAELNSNLERNLSILSNLSSNSGPGNLEYRVVDYLAPYTMYIFDPHLPQGHLMAQMSTFRVQNVRKRPGFTLTHQYDRVWFEHFVEQFESLWGEAVLYKPTKN